MTKVKICGITTVDDARAAIEAGVDSIGFIFAESPRQISVADAEKIWRTVDRMDCVATGVFVDAHPLFITQVVDRAGLECVQLSGSESAETVNRIKAYGISVVKSLRISTEKDISVLGRFRPDAFLLDTYVPGQAGGTGKTFDWQLAVAAKPFGRIILAGGLGVDNVRRAIETVDPYGVDASSRLELRPGVKDHERVRRFIRIVKDINPSPDEGISPWPK